MCIWKQVSEEQKKKPTAEQKTNKELKALYSQSSKQKEKNK